MHSTLEVAFGRAVFLYFSGVKSFIVIILPSGVIPGLVPSQIDR